MRIGEIRNEAALPAGKPLDGIRVLALEQLIAMPFCTQMLARLGADVVKIERPGTGESGRLSLPAMTDADGRRAGATFLRYNLSKRSVAVDITTEKGRDLVLGLAPHFDVVAQNFRAGVIDRLGLGYEAVRAVAPKAVYVSVSGFGTDGSSPYSDWPSYAPIAEAMTGVYEMKRVEGRPPIPVPLGGVGDIGTSMFAVIGVMAALMHRERTGQGQHVDVSMFDSMLSITDIVTNFWSFGLTEGQLGPQIMDGFRAGDGWFVIMVIREPEFVRLATAIGRPEWTTDPRLSTREGWVAHLDDVIRPGIEGWASSLTRSQACAELSRHGVAAAPCLRAGEVANDPHVAAHDMLIEIDRSDGVAQPVLVPGNPVKLSNVAVGPTQAPPLLGQHTDEVLSGELGLSADELTALRAEGVIG